MNKCALFSFEVFFSPKNQVQSDVRQKHYRETETKISDLTLSANRKHHVQDFLSMY